MAQSPAAEPSAAAESLLTDVRRIIAAHEEAGWFVDEEEFAVIETLLLESACRTPLDARQQALAVLAEAAVPDPQQLYLRSRGELTDDVERALTARRRWVALERTLDRSDECPFFIEPDVGFAGRQTERNKWVIHLEGGGVAEALRVGGHYAVGGGGNGRLLLGRGFEDSTSLLVGGEVGGGAELNRPSEGEQFTLKYTAALPLVVRFHDVAWLYDAEVAPVALLDADDLHLSWGGRLGLAIGLSTLRARDFLPWAGLAVSLDHYFPTDDRPATQVVRAGLRIGIRWLP